jgi:Rrf2 family transcriptional regulator, cysteine metabolism repressor
MKLSTRTRYGLRALLDLAMNSKGIPVQLKDIAARQEISLSYLEHLIIPLISAGIIRSTRGAKGGIELAKEPALISVKDILEVLEGPVAPVDCLKDNNICSRSCSCATRDLWEEMKKAMDSVLDANTLQDLVNRQKSKTGSPNNMYYI